jgi:hypothetical protein
MTTVQQFAAEYEPDDGFFLKLRFNKFDPDGGRRVLAAIRSCSLTLDHPSNYEKLFYLWGMGVDLQAAMAHNENNSALKELDAELFPEFARIFDVELRQLVEGKDPSAPSE